MGSTSETRATHSEFAVYGLRERVMIIHGGHCVLLLCRRRRPHSATLALPMIPFQRLPARSMRRGKGETKEKGRNDNRLTLVESSKTRSITSENFLLNKNPYFSYNNFYYKAKQRKIDPLFSLINVEEFWKFSGEGERRGGRPRSIVERTQICGPVFDSPTYRLTNCL